MNFKNKPRNRENNYAVVKIEKKFPTLNDAIIELNKINEKGFNVVKIVKGIARICVSCKSSMGKNNFKFCPHCGNRF
jgi:hypothetical protein